MEKNSSEKQWDVFISYARRDIDFVRVLAENLHQGGLEVFWDEWEIGPGDRLVHKLEEGLLHSKNGVLVVSPVALSRPWVLEEYATLVRMAVENGKLLVPALFVDAQLPPFLANRVWVDFRDAYGPRFEKNVNMLIRALKGKGPQGPPARDGKMRARPDEVFRPEGPIVRTLEIARDQVVFSGGCREAFHKPRGLGHEDERRLYELDRARRRAVPEDSHVHRPGPGRDGAVRDPDSPLYSAVMAAGAALGRAFLTGDAGDAVREAVRQAQSLNASLRIALSIDDPSLANLPWESVRIPEKDGSPGPALALHPNIRLYRRGGGNQPVPSHAIPAPFRVLAAVGSPEAQNARGELLDMELETMRILDALEKAGEKAHAEILENGSLDAIGKALESSRYHVVHISCHARPGHLILETDQGGEDLVSAEKLREVVLHPDRGVPLIVLAGCSTGLREGVGEKQLLSMAESLLERGATCVVAMCAPVSDRYATEFCGLMYEYLATAQKPDPLSAFFEARAGVERMRQNETDPMEKAALEDWAAPALFVRGMPLDLYDPRAPAEKIEPRDKPVFTEGVCVLGPGHFVGRRRDLRVLLQKIQGPDRAGAVIHGMGGCGKSSLAARLFHRLAERGWMAASVAGQTDVDTILGELGSRLFGYCIARKPGENEPLRQIAMFVQDGGNDWRQRFELLAREVFPNRKIALLLDNFEDNLEPDRTVSDKGLQADLKELLSLWARRPGKTRLVFTCRYPFHLPEEAETFFTTWHVGPLSMAETRKLAWRLPAIKALDKEDFRRAYESVGGHPRALEYLDALLRGGKARFTRVEKKLRDAIRKKENVTDPGRWCRDTEKNLDRSLAETVALAAEDVLLDGLLKMLDKTPLAKKLLFWASVYRLPVHETGLIWQIGRETKPNVDPEKEALLELLAELLKKANAGGKKPAEVLNEISPDEMPGIMAAVEEMFSPPVEPPENARQAVRALENASLLSPVKYADDDPEKFTVHRWTANALIARMDENTRKEAHRRAAGYWNWRAGFTGKSVDPHMEARFHFFQCGDLEKAVRLSEIICDRLDTWGFWRREERLCHETLGWLPERSEKSAAFLHQLGIIHHNRGDYGQALDWYRKSLEIKQELENRAGMAKSYHQMGMVSQDRGAYDEALDGYRKSLEIDQELENRAGMAKSYHQMGRVSQDRGAYDEALDWYRKALEIFQELENRAGMAASYHQMGIVSQARGAYDEALDGYRKALEIFQELGNRAGMANSYHQMGRVSQDRGAYDEALDWYRKALEIDQELGNRAGMAANLGQIGILYSETEQPETGVPYNLESLAIRMELRVPFEINLKMLGLQKKALGEQRFREIVVGEVGEKSAGEILELMEKAGAANE